MYNRTIFMGRICNDLEIKTTPSGVSVLSFTVAVDRAYQADKQNKVSDFFPCVAWRNEAEFISRFWSKGKMILVEGELQNRKYTDKAGVERQITELIVDRACFTGEKASGTHEQPPPPEEPPQYKNQEKAATDNNVGSKEQKQLTAEDMAKAADDYPF
jgi:single-strand DNA-binding protein